MTTIITNKAFVYNSIVAFLKTLTGLDEVTRGQAQDQLPEDVPIGVPFLLFFPTKNPLMGPPIYQNNQAATGEVEQWKYEARNLEVDVHIFSPDVRPTSPDQVPWDAERYMDLLVARLNSKEVRATLRAGKSEDFRKTKMTVQDWSEPTCLDEPKAGSTSWIRRWQIEILFGYTGVTKEIVQPLEEVHITGSYQGKLSQIDLITQP